MSNDNTPDTSRDQDRKISEDVLLANVTRNVLKAINGMSPQIVLRALAVAAGHSIHQMSPNEDARRHNIYQLAKGIEVIVAANIAAAEEATQHMTLARVPVRGEVSKVTSIIRPDDNNSKPETVQ
jgi:hypothetical protein